MANYLKGYLSSIPKYDYDRVIAYLEELMTIHLPQIDLEATLANISSAEKPTVNGLKPDQYTKATTAYNEIYSKIYIDLVYLYHIIDLLYAATNNYSDLSTAYIGEINSEIDRIYNVLEEIKLRETYRENTFAFKEEFKTKINIEDNILEKNKYLYRDRDDSVLGLLNIVSTNDKSYAILEEEYEIDLLRSKEGDVQSKIFIRDYCGVPASQKSDLALDSSKYTHWDTTVYSKAPIKTQINHNKINGAWVQFVVQLPRVCDISNLEIMPFSLDPVHIKAYIDGELILDEITNDTAISYFRKRPVDEITVEILQENYIYKTVTLNDKRDEAKELWETKQEDKDNYSFYIDKYASEFDDIVNYWEYRLNNTMEQ